MITSLAYDLITFWVDKDVFFPWQVLKQTPETNPGTWFYFKSWTRLSPYIFGLLMG